VDSAALSYVLPVTAGGMRDNLPAGATRPAVNAPVEFDIIPVSPGFFPTVGIPLVAGRDFSDTDGERGPKVIVINEQMKKRFWPASDALGQTFAAGSDRYTVIGIAHDSKYRNLRETPRMTMYVPLEQLHMPAANILVRSSLPAGAVAAMLRDIMRGIDPALPIYNVRTLAEHVDRSLYVDRLRALLISGFAVLALLLAALGTYGVVSFNVTRRQRELGIRLALGAQRRRIVTMLLVDVARLAVLGIVTGGGAAIWLGRFVASELFGVAPWDLPAFIGSAAVLVVVALAATYLPARRAVAIDPLTSVRED
jgi:predicted permease